ncbi:low-affinity phosphate transporter [Tieghemiomyces parasiticus]|uniref:Low-affinity phosphate transporter n=1 Tax=Tieghemiomyces parasiticus TaxID=78921 RepID=A0A9W8DZE8_9FUNG|nr:low-affinity phosphate transporter [Tieghemiomyces parasiticus]
MKFSSALQFNSVPEWADYYLAYSHLKKLLYQIEKEVFTPTTYPPNETAPQRSSVASLPDDSGHMEPGARCRALFVPALNIELQKIVDFYTRKEAELYQKFHAIRGKVDDVACVESLLITVADNAHSLKDDHVKTFSDKIAIPSAHRTTKNDLTTAFEFSAPSSAHGVPASTDTAHNSGDDHDGDDESLASSRHSFRGRLVNSEEHRRELTDQARDLFILLSDLKSYVNLNYTGFTKILKKYDKVTSSSLRESYIERTLLPVYPFREETRQSLDQHLLSLRRMYAELGRFPDLAGATKALRACLREQVVWERNTVWRDMISQERKVSAVGVRPATIVDDVEPATGAGPSSLWQRLTPYARQILAILGCTAIFIILLLVPIFRTPEEQNCLALLIYVSLLWATEALPLFATAFLVPLLVVMLRVLRSEGQDPARLEAKDAAKEVFAAMFSPVIMLLLGGFSIAAAMSKHNIAKTVASMVLSLAGTKPSIVLLMNMLVATVASMLISNVAAPVLCFSLIQPILRTLPQGSPFARCLIIGIAMASNVGGMSSPISSPQNAIALQNMSPEPNWLEWFGVALPVAFATDILVWGFLLLIYRPANSTPAVHQARFVREPFTFKQWFIIGVTLVTIVLWCVESAIRAYVGHMGVIAILPLLVLFGTGLLTKEDFNNFLWTTIMLAMGGVALGRAVQSSGLLHTVATLIQARVEDCSLYAVYVIFCGLMLFVATFISHTVGASIILPVVNGVGLALPHGHARLLVFGSTLMCSGAMGLPVSGFPNMTAIMMEDETGKPYVTTKDFLVAGVPSSVLAFVVIITAGYGLGLAFGL